MFMKSFVSVIKEGGVAVIRTDTLYGIVGSALDQHVVERIYCIKNRDPLKPVVVLVADYEQITSLGAAVTPSLRKDLDQYWPGKVSVILPVNDSSTDTHYIHKGTGGIAFRIPEDADLRKLIKETGPLVAPSANPEGEPPARTITEATAYFGESVDHHPDGGELTHTKPSTFVRITSSTKVEVLRD